MTAILEPEHVLPPDGGRPDQTVGIFQSFDLLDRVGIGIARFAGVEMTDRRETAPRIDAQLLKDAATAVLSDPAKSAQRRLLIGLMSLVAAFSAVVAALLASGRLAAVYQAIWSRLPGRQWTDVMRNHPWIYLVLAVGLAIVPFCLAPRDRWGRAFLTYVVFLIGFLGGHVFW